MIMHLDPELITNMTTVIVHAVTTMRTRNKETTMTTSINHDSMTFTHTLTILRTPTQEKHDDKTTADDMMMMMTMIVMNTVSSLSWGGRQERPL